MCESIVFVAIVQLLTAIAPGNPSQKQPDVGSKKVPKYQVDFRIQVAPDLDKQSVVIWMNLLKDLGASSVSQIPGMPLPPGDDDKIDSPFQPAGLNRVEVRAVLGASGLFIGSNGYRMADRPKLAALIKRMQADGVPGPDPSAPMWGLSRSQMDQLQAQLSPPSRFELNNQTFGNFIAQLRTRVKLEIKVNPNAEAVAKTLKLNMNSGELSTGAALAYLLGQNGLAWEPRQGAGGNVTILIMPREDSKRPWPVGLTPEQMPGNVAPNLMAAARYQTNKTPLDEVLEVFRRELKMDVLLDRATLIDRDINPDTLQSTIQVPSGTLSAAIRKTLAQMGLKYELRIDESNRAFLWVTVGEPTGPIKKR
jgi:hypothetical protein